MKKSLISLLAAVALTGCGQHVLFENGKSDYTIVVDSEDSECVQYAAQELQNWVKEVSGVTLPIGDLESGKKGRRLVVGYNSLLQKSLGDAGEPDGQNDSFTWKSKGGDIFLWGDTDRGTLYSVYSILEEELGCRWYTSSVSLTPKWDSWTFTELSHHEAPTFRMRNDFYYDILHHHDHAARLRNNSMLFGSMEPVYGSSADYCGGHSLVGFVSVNEYYDTHPEYFSEIDGKRIKERAQICLSNPDVLKIVTEKVRNLMRTQPGYLVYSVSQGDWGNPCQCEECRKIKEQYGNQESGILVWFVNQVADAVKDEFPDKFVGTFAYQYSRHAPENIKPHDNVVIRLCSIEECQLHDFDSCERNTSFRTDLQEWSAIAPHLYIWDYSTAFSNYLLPLPNVWTFQNRLQYYRDNNVFGLMPEGSYQGPENAFEDMKTYILAKLMWNADCDVDAVIEDFTDGYFGPVAGPVIRDYMDFERQILARSEVHEACYPWEDSELYTDEFVTKGKEFFEKAKDAVRENGGDDVDEYIRRIEYAEIAICYLELMRDPHAGVEDGSFDLFKRVVEKEGISQIREGGFWADEFIEEVENKTKDMKK